MSRLSPVPEKLLCARVDSPPAGVGCNPAEMFFFAISAPNLLELIPACLSLILHHHSAYRGLRNRKLIKLHIPTNSPYSRSPLKDRSFTNEFLLSCARENPHVIILDSHKYSVTKPKPNKYPVKTSPPPSKLVQGPQKQPIASANQSLPSKRARSSSPPTLANRKSIKTELSSAVPSPSSKSSSPSTHQRSTNVTAIRQRREVGMSGNAVPLQLAARKEKKRETCVHQIHHSHRQVGENGSREVFSENSSRIPLMEDRNNPLISMDCFIFI